MFSVHSVAKANLNMCAKSSASQQLSREKDVNLSCHTLDGGAAEIRNLGEAASKRRPTRRLSSGRNSNRGNVSRSASPSEKSNYRCFVNHSYHDHAQDPEDEQQPVVIIEAAAAAKNKKDFHHVRGGPRGGVSTPFPEKLHEMLSKAEPDMFDHVVSWHSHGRSFVVHQPKRFVTEIMPRFFKQSKLTSFQRQLNLYGFSRLTAGPDRGGYYHELFLRGRLHLCKRMIRTRVKGTGVKAAASPSTEPNFHDMEPCHEDDIIGNRKVTIQSLPSSINLGMDYVANSVHVPAVIPDETGSSEGVSLCDSDDTEDIPFRPVKEQPDHVMSSKPWSHGLLHQAVESGPDAIEADVGNWQTSRCSSPFATLLESNDFADAIEMQCHSGDEMVFEGQIFHYLDTDFFLKEDEVGCGLHTFSVAPSMDESIPSFVEWQVDDTLGEMFIST